MNTTFVRTTNTVNTNNINLMIHCQSAVAYIDAENNIMTTITDMGNYVLKPPKKNSDFINMLLTIDKEHLCEHIGKKSVFDYDKSVDKLLNLFDDPTEQQLIGDYLDDMPTNDNGWFDEEIFHEYLRTTDCYDFWVYNTDINNKRLAEIAKIIKNNISNSIVKDYPSQIKLFADIFVDYIQPLILNSADMQCIKIDFKVK